MTVPWRLRGLRTKLVASYVALSVTITLASILAGQYVRARADGVRNRHAVVLRGVEEIAALTGSADEEGFSYVVAGDSGERALATSKVTAAETRASALLGTATLSADERAALEHVVSAVSALHHASTAMFDEFEHEHVVAANRYDAYDQAIDDASEAVSALDRATVDETARTRESIRRTSDALTMAIGLLAMIGAVVGGSLIGRRISRPLVELRNAAVAFGVGQLELTVAEKSADEVGELASAFERMALAIRQQMAQLANAQKLEALGLVAGSVAHDFNNVLATVVTCSQLALEDLGEGHPVSNDLRDIADAARRGARLSQQLLHFGRPRAASPRVLSVNEAVESIEPMLARLVGARVKMRVTRDPGAPFVCIDATQLDQVLMNLVVNARDASPDGGVVELCTTPTELPQRAMFVTGPLEAGSYVLVEVRDHGAGMNEGTMARLFEPFFTTKEPGKGTGLGLATVARVVREAGGAVALQSAPGQGTTFGVYLPLADGPTPSLPPAPVRASEVWA